MASICVAFHQKCGMAMVGAHFWRWHSFCLTSPHSWVRVETQGLKTKTGFDRAIAALKTA